MPTVYRRKNTGENRGAWTEDQLKQALSRLAAGEIGVNEAARYYGIPSRTLRRRREMGNTQKICMGHQGVFGVENEKRLVKHIQCLEKCGFSPDRETIRKLAFQFAEELGLVHRFSLETRMAGYDWLSSFLRRNPELSVRQAQGLSIARGEGMNREDVKKFFKLLLEVFKENNLFTKPGNIFNMDETGCQLNNVPGKVVATKGAKDVHTLTSAEKGENVTVIACCNAEGQYLPPSVIFKGVREKKEFSDGLPPGSMVFMNEKSSYISTDIFFRWLKEVFVPRKPQGKTLLILDGHSSHVNCYDLLEFANKNDIIIVCLPSHTTQALQPLDRAFFKPLKHYFKDEARKWIVHHPGRTIGRIQASELIGRAWKRAASVATAVNGFRETGIFPLNDSAVPDHFFAVSEEMNQASEQLQSCPQPSTFAEEVPSPTKILQQISPVPKLEKRCRKRKKQTAKVLTSNEHIEDKKMKSAAKFSKASKKLRMDMPLENDESDPTDDCLECGENYYSTKEMVDWIKCVMCLKWLHESCTMYGDLCNVCGRAKIRDDKKKALA